MKRHLFRKNTERTITAIAIVVMLAIVSACTTVIYWLAGGEFQRGPSFAIFAMVLIYMWTLVFKVALEKHAERTKKPESCRICGFSVVEKH